MDKQLIVTHHKNIVDKEGVFLKSLDLISNVLKFHESIVTPFLTPEMRVVLEEVIRFEPEIECLGFGGFDGAERQKLGVFQSYAQPPEPYEFLKLLRISYRQQFNQLSHRDCLGAILGLGISRQKIGDINVTDSYIDVIVDPEITQYILMNLEKVGRAGVKVEAIDLSQISRIEIKTKVFNDTVKSLRLDAIVASGFKTSRNDAQGMIDAGLVRVNYKEALNTSMILNQGDLISVRGKGRFMLTEIEGQTRKDRVRVVLTHYIS